MEFFYVQFLNFCHSICPLNIYCSIKESIKVMVLTLDNSYISLECTALFQGKIDDESAFLGILFSAIHLQLNMLTLDKLINVRLIS